MNISAIYNSYTAFAQTPVSRISPIESHEVPQPEPDDAVQNNSQDESKESEIQTDSVAKDKYNNDLSRAELQLVQDLKQTDTKVRNHEMAHIAAGGKYITSGANFSYQRGPDGKNYVVGGEVGIDTSPIPGDPDATIKKMNQIKNAALAPADPSPQDIKVASQATHSAAKAMSELMILKLEKQATSNENQAFGTMKQASDSYIKVNNLPEKDDSSFKIAV